MADAVTEHLCEGTIQPMTEHLCEGTIQPMTEHLCEGTIQLSGVDAPAERSCRLQGCLSRSEVRP